MAEKSFKAAFAAARKKLGAGKTFTWKGKSYSTNYAEEGKKGFSIEMASAAIDKASGVNKPPADMPRPKKKPADLVAATPVAAPAKITTTKLADPASTKVVGRPEGKASGMPAAAVVKNKTRAEVTAKTPLKSTNKTLAQIAGEGLGSLAARIAKMNTLPKPLNGVRPEGKASGMPKSKKK